MANPNIGCVPGTLKRKRVHFEETDNYNIKHARKDGYTLVPDGYDAGDESDFNKCGETDSVGTVSEELSDMAI